MNPRPWRWAALLAALSLFPVSAPAMDKLISINVHSSLDKNSTDVDKGRMGLGDQETTNATFTAEITSSEVDPVKNIRVKVYVVQSDYVWESDPIRPRVGKVLEKSNIDLDAGESKTVDIGTVVFKNFETNNGWRGGDYYEGWVAEVYLDNNLISVTDHGGKLVHDIYKKYLEKNGGPPPAASN